MAIRKEIPVILVSYSNGCGLKDAVLLNGKIGTKMMWQKIKHWLGIETNYFVSYYINTEYGSGFGSTKIISNEVLDMNFMKKIKEVIKRDLRENNKISGVKDIVIVNVITLER